MDGTPARYGRLTVVLKKSAHFEELYEEYAQTREDRYQRERGGAQAKRSEQRREEIKEEEGEEEEEGAEIRHNGEN